MDNKHFVSVAGLVKNDDNQVLLIKSPDRGWEYPGGVVEFGESLEAALIREIKEESGVDVEIIGFVGLCKNIERNILNIDFVCKYVSGGLATSDESLEGRWFSMEEAVNIVEAPLTKKRLVQMLSHDKEVHIFSFRKDPFSICTDEKYKMGTE